MKRINLLYLLLLLLSSCAEGDNIDVDNIYVDYTYSRRGTITNNNNDTVHIYYYGSHFKSLDIRIDSIVKCMDQNSSTQTQGASCFDYYLFDFGNNLTYIHMYNLKTRSLINRINSKMSNTLYHCNNVSFSNLYYSEFDLFPLLFVSQQRTTPQEVQVCRIVGEVNNPDISVASVIMLPDKADICVKNRSDVVLDNENHAMYLYTEDKDYNLCLIKFEIPQIMNNDTIYLTEKEIKEISIFDSRYVAKQGAVINNGFLYVIKGIPNRNPLGLTIINLSNHYWTEFDLSYYGVDWEPEGLFFYEDELYCTSNFNKGIYKIHLNTISSTKIHDFHFDN